MKEFKGTEGEWEICEHSWSDRSIIANDKTVCTNSIYYDATEETQEELENEADANFALIAASKDMLSALESVLRLESIIAYPYDTKEEHMGEAEAIQSMLTKCQSAINKALTLNN